MYHTPSCFWAPSSSGLCLQSQRRVLTGIRLVAWTSAIVRCSRASLPALIASTSRLDDEDADTTLLPVAEAVVHEGELPRHVTEQLEAHAAPRCHGPCLRAADRRRGRGTQVHRIELLAHNVEVAGVCGAGIHEPEANAVAHFHADRGVDGLVGPPVGENG